MWRGGCLVGVAQTTEHPQMAVGRRGTQKTLKRRDWSRGMARTLIEEVSHGGERPAQKGKGMPTWMRRLRTQLFNVRMIRSAFPF
jgi:hypothetical protein